jgi:hypothetical protein
VEGIGFDNLGEGHKMWDKYGMDRRGGTIGLQHWHWHHSEGGWGTIQRIGIHSLPEGKRRRSLISTFSAKISSVYFPWVFFHFYCPHQ